MLSSWSPPGPRRSPPIPRPGGSIIIVCVVGAAAALLPAATACRSASSHRSVADTSAASIIAEKQREALGRSEPFTIERPSETFRRKLLLAQSLPSMGRESLGAEDLEPTEHWPEEGYPYTGADSPDGATGDPTVDVPWDESQPYELSLTNALRIGARNSRDYQSNKESIFLAALDLDVERNRFRNIFFSTLAARAQNDSTADRAADGYQGTAEVGGSRLLESGTLIASSIAIDLAKLASGDRDSSLGIFADASITIPLLRGAGAHVVTEPLTQAERNTVYSIRAFERFKRIFAVQVASAYFDVLRQEDQVVNAAENYRNLVVLSRRTQAMAAAGRLPGVQVDQAEQDVLRARDSWVSTQQSLQARFDSFKELLGLPPDARIVLADTELEEAMARVERVFGAIEDATPAAGNTQPAAADDSQQQQQDMLLPFDAPVELLPPSSEGGPLEVEEELAVRTALERREDLLIARGRVYDAQRAVAVAADALEAGLTLAGGVQAGGRRSIGSADQENAPLEPKRGIYTADLLIDLPIERTAERDAYRESFILLEQALRDAQEVEDRIKLEVREGLRRLLEAREGIGIQRQAVRLAIGRVESTNLLLDAGRAQVRDVLEAQEDLLSARNAFTDAVIRYRVAELELQRDVGVLTVDSDGVWTEVEIDGGR